MSVAGKCLEKLNVTAGDSRDAQGRYRFFPFTPESHLVAEKFPKNFWYWKYIFYPQPKVRKVVSLYLKKITYTAFFLGMSALN